MSKRFTETTKWNKEHFSSLSTKMKLVWIYLCDNCDHAGIWDVNYRLMSFQLGEYVSQEDIQEAFADKILFLDENKIFIPAFIEFQYGNLNPDNRVHQSVLIRLNKVGASKPLISPFQGAKDKDKDKDKDKEQAKDKDKDKEQDKLAPQQKIETGFTTKALADLWNRECGSFPKVARLTEPRKNKARAQLDRYPDEQHWVLAIQKFTESSFCRNTWRPGFDDLLNETKRLRAIEGSYADKVSGTINPLPFDTVATRRSANNAALLQKVMAGEV